jgi:hypothetical protein
VVAIRLLTVSTPETDAGVEKEIVMRRSAFVLTAVGMLVAGVACGGTEDAASPTAATPMTTAAPMTAVDEQQEVVLESGIPFGTFGDVTLTLDLYLPADPSDAPIVIDPWYPDELAQAGAIVAVIDQSVPDTDEEDYAVRYLSDHGAHIRAKVEAYGCAVRFVRVRTAELKNDDPIVVLSGFSEGGAIAANVALFGAKLEQRWNEFAAEVGGPARQVECMVADGSTNVDGLVAGGAPYDMFVPVIDGLYGRAWMQEHDPELQQFLASALGGNADLTVRLAYGVDDPLPSTVAEDFEAALAEAGYDVVLIIYEGGHHAPSADVGLDIYAELLGL